MPNARRAQAAAPREALRNFPRLEERSSSPPDHVGRGSSSAPIARVMMAAPGYIMMDEPSRARPRAHRHIRDMMPRARAPRHHGVLRRAERARRAQRVRPRYIMEKGVIVCRGTVGGASASPVTRKVGRLEPESQVCRQCVGRGRGPSPRDSTSRQLQNSMEPRDRLAVASAMSKKTRSRGGGPPGPADAVSQ